MSESLFPLDLLTFVVFSLLAVISALLVVEHRSLVYSAVFLGLLGMANAVLFALMGYAFVSVFHLAVYVGAAVIFILFSVTMMREAPLAERGTRLAALIIIPLIAISMGIVFSYFGRYPIQPTPLSYRDLSSLLVDRYWLPAIVTSIALVTTLIEAITIARREVDER